jgi:hypothetical protein
VAALPAETERLEQLLATAQQIGSLDPAKSLFDLSWNAFSEYESGNKEKAASYLVDLNKHPETASVDYLYNYKNSVGVMLTLYLAKRLNAFEYDDSLVRKVLTTIKDWRWHDGTGEVIFAYALLLNEVSHADAELDEVRDMCANLLKEILPDYEKIARKANDMAFGLLVLEYLRKGDEEDPTIWLEKSEEGLNRLVEFAQLETLSVMLWAACLSKSRRGSAFLANFVEVVSRKVQAQIEELERLSVDPEIVERLIEAIQLAKEGLVSHAKEKLSLIEAYSNDRLTVNLSDLNVGSPRVAALAKARIALVKSGFYRPFMLSSDQDALYRKILTAEEGGTYYVRKHEFGAWLVAGGVLTAAAMIEVAAYLALSATVATGLFFAGLWIYSDLAWGVWTEGAITRHSVSRVFRRIQESL